MPFGIRAGGEGDEGDAECEAPLADAGWTVGGRTAAGADGKGRR